MKLLSNLAVFTMVSMALGAGQVQAAGFTYQTPPLEMPFHNTVYSETISVKADSQGNMYAAVMSGSPGYLNLPLYSTPIEVRENGKLFKYTPDGQTAWVKDFDPNNPRPVDRYAYVISTGIAAVAVDKKDNIYVVGESFNGTSLDCLLKKYNTNGDLIWQTRHGIPVDAYGNAYNQYCHDLTVDQAGDIIAGGTVQGFKAVNASGFNGNANQILKWDANGKLIGVFNASTSEYACGESLGCGISIVKVATDLDQNIYTLESVPLANRYAKYSADLKFLSATKLHGEYNEPTVFMPTALAVDTQGHVFGSGVQSGNGKMVVMDKNFNQLCEAPAGVGPIVIGKDEKAYYASITYQNVNAMAYDAQCQPQWVDASGAPAPLKAYVKDLAYRSAVTLDNNSNLIIGGAIDTFSTVDAMTLKFSRTVVPTSSDLVVPTLSATSGAKAGQSVSASGFVNNVGTGATGAPHWVGMYLSTDNVIDRQDVLLCRAQVGAQTPNDMQPWSCAGTPSVNLPTGTYYLGALADDGNLVSESNETNNTANQQLQFTGRSVLVVASGSVPATAQTGQQITVTATIKNRSRATASAASTAAVYFSTDSTVTASDTPFCTAAVSPLAADATQTVSCTGTIPSPLYYGNYYIGVQADSTNSVEELSPIWTQAIKISALPDLTFSSASSPTTAQRGQTINLSGTIANIGYGPTGDLEQYQGYYLVRMYLSQDNVITPADTQICVIGYRGQDVNSTVPLSCSPALSATLTPGNYYIGFVVDSSNSVVESNETNNIKVNPITITLSDNEPPPPPPAKPDLVVVSGSAASSAKTGEQITVSGTIKNYGAGPASATTAGIYLSTDLIITASDTLLCTAAVGPLAAGATQAVSCTGTIPANTYDGDYGVGILADQANAVAEIGEDNNRWSQVLTVSGPGDLVVETAVSPATAQKGQTITVSGTVKNQGFGKIMAYWIRVYLSQDNVITTADNLVCSSLPVGSTVPNSTQAFTCTGTIPTTLTAGSYSLGVFADASNIAVESNETNNIKVNPITITEAASYFASTPVTQATVGQQYVYPVVLGNVDTVTNPAGCMLTRYPDEMTAVGIDPYVPGSARILWTPTAASAGQSYAVTIACVDKANKLIQQSFSIAVNP